jgi:hypothetical protein
MSRLMRVLQRVCTHLDQINDVEPSAAGCEDFHTSEHPLVQSFQPYEDWIWCYVDEVVMEPAS